jgi:hypothetical protein
MALGRRAIFPLRVIKPNETRFGVYEFATVTDWEQSRNWESRKRFPFAEGCGGQGMGGREAEGIGLVDYWIGGLVEGTRQRLKDELYATHTS